MQDRVWQIERYSWIIHLHAMNISWSFIIQICYSICNILKSPRKYQQDFWVQQVDFSREKKKKKKQNPNHHKLEDICIVYRHTSFFIVFCTVVLHRIWLFFFNWRFVATLGWTAPISAILQQHFLSCVSMSHFGKSKKFMSNFFIISLVLVICDQ